jgi:hypothetical protein
MKNRHGITMAQEVTVSVTALPDASSCYVQFVRLHPDENDVTFLLIH